MFRTRGLMIAAATGVMAAALFAGSGPSSSQTPYLSPVAPGVDLASILTVGDTVQKGHDRGATYRMVGIPDGLGAYDNGDGTFTVLMNHEITPTRGIVREHGGMGAFVSQWQIRKTDLKVLRGEDLMKKVMLWDASGNTYFEATNAAFSRFCSADMADSSAFFNRKTGKGFRDGRIFMNGEEDDSSPRRAMAHIVSGCGQGTSFELPKMGKHAFENLLASPFEQDKTIVAETEDGGLNRVYFYIGDKQREKQSGRGEREDGRKGESRGEDHDDDRDERKGCRDITAEALDLAGLTNGISYEVSIPSYSNDDPATGFKSGRFSLVLSGGTSLARPEDGAWDTTNPNRFYFVTTASITGNSRLWRMTFDDITHPELGGSIEVLVNGSSVPSPQIRMMDNITVDGDGKVYMQEDAGNVARLGQVWRYDPATQIVTNLAQHDPTRFLSGGANFLTQDEESSGIIDVTEMFKGVRGYDTRNNRYLLLDVQAHYTIPAPDVDGLVEGGQLLMMKVPK